MYLPPQLDALIQGFLEEVAVIRKRLEKIEKSLSDLASTATAAEERERSKEQHETKIRGEVWFPERVEHARSAQQEKQHATQNVIAVTTFLAALAASIYAGIAACQLKEMRKATIAATKSANTAAAQLELTDRAWVTVEITACTECGPRDIRGGPLTFGKDGRGSLTFTISLKNIGKSVANHAWPRFKPLAIGWDDLLTDPYKMPLDEQRKLCSGPADNSKIEGYTIFPNDAQVEVWGPMGFDTKQIRENLNLHLKNGKPIRPLLIGCVDYDYPSSTAQHQTGFIYEAHIGKTNQVIQTLVPVPIDQLTFRPYGFGGKYAY
jgi:hypothetical protein